MEPKPDKFRAEPSGVLSHSSAIHRVMQEIAAYLGPKVLTHEEKVSALVFWKRQSLAYPHLSVIARHYLTPNASSVPLESMFSISGIIKNSRRSSIVPHRLNRLCFVHDNYAKFFPV